jgi:hypothetical protein
MKTTTLSQLANRVLVPSATYWYRLEPRPRTNSLAGPTAAPVRDPLWFITRQWQMGEFLAEDAASPAYVEIGSSYGSLTDWKSSTGSSQPIPVGVPLEPLVEREALTPDLSLSVELGQTFELLLIQDHGGSIVQRNAFRVAFPLKLPANADPDTVRFLSICSGRATDGVALFRALQSGAATPPAPAGTLADFQAWVTDVFGDIGTADPVTWNPNVINYEVKAEGTLPSNTAGEFTATPARDGAFDWFAFDLASQTTTPPLKPPTKNPSLTVIPTHVRFRGMPNAKWWDFENNVTDYGAIDVQRQDLAKLAVMDFMLLHGNDWFLVPVDIPVNSLYRIESFLVRDVFGGLTSVDRTDRTKTATGGRWTMFSTIADGGVADFLLLPPTASVAMQTGNVLEDLRFLRDPTANMDWAIEFEVEGGIGQPLYGAEEDARNRPAQLPPGGPGQAGAVIRYQIETPVPTDWFPYVPVEVTNVVTQVVLRQGEVERGTASLVVPKGRVLLGVKELREQEVPRTGVRITRVANRSRWLDGSTHLWIARRKTSGRGEGSSGLRFDVALPE